MKTKEIRTGSSIWFSRKSGSAYISKMKNNKHYFVSKVNKSFLSDDYYKIKNGEYFFITGIKSIKELNHSVVLTMTKENDANQITIRYEDLFHFCTN